MSEQHDTMEQRPARMRLRSWRRLRSGSVCGFACVDLPCGLEVAEIMVCRSRFGGFRALMPQRPLVRGGKLQLGSDGKPRYDTPVQWRSHELRKRWSVAVVALVQEAWPADLVEEEEAEAGAADAAT